ncbi:hypothetical protein [Nocardia sp. CC201C]|uniref:hypothetical protein n=1 Tax=Nocardia sp. CC201C TaxID=3044575 RepID=UPI0024A9C77F|nr:hypothetical protein [Nocardia sp. CC201C]
MAYLSTAAHADNDDGRGGCGYLETHWHDMPEATVTRLPEGDIRGDIEICWSVGFYDGVRADLTVSEARTLRDNLTRAINQYFGIDNDVENPDTLIDAGAGFEPEEFVFCQTCYGRIWPVGTSPDWWMHEYEDQHTHTAVPAEPEPETGAEVA